MIKKSRKRVGKKTIAKKASTPSKLNFPCVEIVQGAYKLYMFSAPVSQLWQILSVNRRVEDKEEGYQRVLSPSRVRAISRYIKADNPIPLSILVSLDTATIDASCTTLSIPNKPDAGWVIDGQHRLAGAHESETELPLPVIAFIGLDPTDQIRQFVTINREAKGVSTSLYYDLLKYIPERKNVTEVAKERAADLANQLKRDDDSPFFERIVVTTTPRKGELSLNNFVRKVYPLVQEGRVLNIYTEHEQRMIISNYYTALKIVFPVEYTKPNSKFFQTLGFGALMNSLASFFSICLTQQGGFSVSDATKVFKEISHFDFMSWDAYGTGNAAENQAGEDLKSELKAAFETQGDGEGTLRLS